MNFFHQEVVEKSALDSFASDFFQVCNNYYLYFDTIKDKFPKRLVDFYLKNGFHDDNLIDFSLKKRHFSHKSRVDVITVWKSHIGKKYEMKFEDVKFMDISLNLSNYHELGDNLACEFSLEENLFGFEMFFGDINERKIFIKSKKIYFRIIH